MNHTLTHQGSKKETIKLYLFLAVVSLLCILFFSPCTSIITPYFKGDSCIYSVIGQAWSHSDLIPYRDLFDHKGPFVFSFFALAAYIGDIKLGLLLLQSLWLFCSLIAVYRIARFYLSPTYSLLAVGIYLITFLSKIAEGANSEEISLPFCLIPLYLTIKHLKTDFCDSQKKLPLLLDFLVIGVCIGIIWMIRPNNSAVPCACCLISALYLILHGRWHLLIGITSICSVGCLIICVSYNLYFYLHGAWEDFLYCYITFNTKYVSQEYVLKDYALHVIKMPFFILLPYCAYKAHKEVDKCSKWEFYLLLAISAFSYACSCMGKLFAHYLLVTLPAGIYASVITLHHLKKRHISPYVKWAIIAFFVCCCCFKNPHRVLDAISMSTMTINEKLQKHNLPTLFTPRPEWSNMWELVEYRELVELGQLIPIEEKGDFMCFDTFGAPYLYTGTLPSNKFFIIQSLHAAVTPDLEEMMKEDFRTKAPKWMILGKKQVKHPFASGNEEWSSTIPWNSYKEYALTPHFILLQRQQ